MLGASRDDVVFWMSGPLPIVLMIALVIATFHHLQAGMQVVIEDYVHHDGLRIGSILLVKGLSLLLALACIISVLRLGL
jgi:succinate dehydrogenase / fumarate reductase membrane anchor subunit